MFFLDLTEIAVMVAAVPHNTAVNMRKLTPIEEDMTDQAVGVVNAPVMASQNYLLPFLLSKLLYLNVSLLISPKR